MKVHIKKDTHGGYNIWVSLDETRTADLEVTREAFIIASGETRQGALDNGLKEMTKAFVAVWRPNGTQR